MVRTADLYDGPHIDELPDLLVEWCDDGPLANTVTGPAEAAIVRAGSARLGLVEAPNDWARSGEHRPGGLVAVTGPGIRRGRLDDVDLVDVAPTILRLLEIEPQGLDGKPIAAVVAPR